MQTQRGAPVLPSAGPSRSAVCALRRYGRAAATQAFADECIAVSVEHQLPLWHAMGTMLRGWALAEQGGGEEAIAQMFEGVTAYQGMGMGLGARLCIALLAHAYLKVESARTDSAC